jgi:tetratricopeptide (TPR) repeat protein
MNMRLYERAIEFDLMRTIQRCYFDADCGRIKLALDRLKDLEMELGENPKIYYAEGMLRKDSMEQGIKAFSCYTKALELDPNYENAAVNAAAYAPNEEEIRKYIKIAAKLAPIDASIIQKRLEILDESCYKFWQVLIGNSVDTERGALIELALSSTKFPLETELKYRRDRFQILRSLDNSDQMKRETMCEFFPPNERLALHEALEELNRAIDLDPYDATFWNYKASWCRFLGRYEEAIISADEAIKQRPIGYHLPHHNKALIFAKQRKIPEAIACAQEALAQAIAGEKSDEIFVIQELIADLNSPIEEVLLDEMLPVITQIVRTAHITANREINLIMQSNNKDNRASIAEMVDLVKRGINNLHPSPNNAMDYVPGMAELLSYFTPETLFVTLDQIQMSDNISYQNSLTATIYIAVHSEKIMQRDALRLLVLTIFKNAISSGNGDMVRDQYRKAILEVSAAAKDEISNLDQLMRMELERIHPDFPRLIADQAPPDEKGKERARKDTLSKLQGTPYIVNSNNKNMQGQFKANSGGTGCLPLMVVIVCIAIGVFIGVSSKKWLTGVDNWVVGGSGGGIIGYWVASWFSSMRKKK